MHDHLLQFFEGLVCPDKVLYSNGRVGIGDQIYLLLPGPCTRFLIHQWVLPVDKYSHRPVHQEIGLKKLRLDKVLNYLNYLDSGPNRGGKDQRRLCLIELTTILQVALAQVELKIYLTAQVHCKYLYYLIISISHFIKYVRIMKSMKAEQRQHRIIHQENGWGLAKVDRSGQQFPF